jgi:hypothetical protein
LGSLKTPLAFEAGGESGSELRQRYWYAAGGYLYDVVDTPTGDDASTAAQPTLRTVS